MIGLSGIEAISSKPQVPDLLQKACGLPVTRIEAIGQEPLDSLEAFVWKVENYEGRSAEPRSDRVWYASDVTFIHDGEVHGKPSRTARPEDEEGAVPAYIKERYSRPSCACWQVVFGFKMPDNTLRACQAFVSTTVPALSNDEIEAYYSDSSAAGLRLVEYLQDNCPNTTYQVTDVLGASIVEISQSLASQLIVDKVPTAKTLQRLLSEAAEEVIHVGERALGLLAMSIIELLDETQQTAAKLS